MKFLPLPKFIPVGGLKWAVSIAPDLKDDEGNKCHGLTDTDKSTIYINPDQSLEEQWQTLFHEATHAAFFMGGHSQELEENKEEALIRCVESLLWGWLRTMVGRKR